MYEKRWKRKMSVSENGTSNNTDTYDINSPADWVIL